ncbi:hypothetical protein [Methylomusa anaerophila]|uniref:hypothetical protein n=1 Tax=Methylomusa anaerophila TaxID=1930071 RepID=UPI002D1FA509|nr:hypothetical protein [Methylomusa anaerophila]
MNLLVGHRTDNSFVTLYNFAPKMLIFQLSDADKPFVLAVNRLNLRRSGRQSLTL